MCSQIIEGRVRYKYFGCSVGLPDYWAVTIAVYQVLPMCMYYVTSPTKCNLTFLICNKLTTDFNVSPRNLEQWGTWKAGVSLLNTGIRHPGSVMKNVIPIVMAGVIGIYGLIIAVILGGNIPSPTVGTGENIYSIYTGMAHVSWGSCCENNSC